MYDSLTTASEFLEDLVEIFLSTTNTKMFKSSTKNSFSQRVTVDKCAES